MLDQISKELAGKLAADYDKKIIDVICKFTGKMKLDQEDISGCMMVGANGIYTLIYRGTPLLEVHPIEFSRVENEITATRKFIELI